MKIIAEVGSNWKTLDDCFHSIRQAKRAGADVVKFQWFTNKCLYGVAGARRNTPGLNALFECCFANDIEFMCTGFSPDMYGVIDNLVQCHKIASSEITAINILRKVNNLGKPVYLSTGGAEIQQIIKAINFLQDVPVTLFYCVTDYPARVVDFRMLDLMQEIFGNKVSYGYSDHSIDVLNIPKLAMDHGAQVLEKHVNFTTHTDTPDAPHSLNFEEFKLMCDHLKGETTVQDTFKKNPHQRKMITLADGSESFFRPSVDV